MTKKPTLVCLSDVPRSDPATSVAERSYRRGCHQTAARIARQVPARRPAPSGPPGRGAERGPEADRRGGGR
jgi:hypothetical protein